MIKALIVDCFGVIVTDTWVAFRDKHFGGNPKLLQEARDASRALDLGLITKSEFQHSIARLSGLPIEDAYAMLDAKSVLDTRVLDSIRGYKASCKIGMLSNISPTRLEDFLTENDKKLFDDLALSYQTGFLKPDSRAYTTAAERLGVQPDQCVFIDDQQRNLFPAEELGMKTIHYQTFDQFERDLKKLVQ